MKILVLQIINKLLSARFLMAVIVTIGACLITWKVIERYPDHAGSVITGFMTTWMAIVKDYFGRQDRDVKQQAEPKENKNGTGT